MRRVVVTGLGLVTPLGCGVNHVWNRLINAESGIDHIKACDVSDLPSRIGGEVPLGPTSEGLYSPDDFVLPKEQRKMDDFIVKAITAASEAVDDSGWKPDGEEDLFRTGVMIGSGIGGLKWISQGERQLHDKGPRRVSPFFIPAALINLASGHVSIRYGFKGPNHSVVTACSTGGPCNRRCSSPHRARGCGRHGGRWG